ncbi:helix-turn-helix domain-containing protein [Actinomadura sp. WAC 06369]|uniref:helix-turn-helix domain-containing protein n=1 Tax=Actinomadura sp. WAC 06369 TaxID=2203193 RepID=UPI000F781550|nr:helix-turn-helix domain-containing protein [Actinomadura sp. WAC 06369]RSN71345.1 hypothetical protein DMH08_02785 [Actinomadura sp. WAC 06369]
MTDPRISARTVAVLVAAVNLRRVYRLHAHDDRVRDDLAVLARIAYEWHHLNNDVDEVAIDQPPPPPWELTPTEAANLLGVSPWSIRWALREGHLEGVKKGWQWSISIRALADYQNRPTGRTRHDRPPPRHGTAA